MLVLRTWFRFFLMVTIMQRYKKDVLQKQTVDRKEKWNFLEFRQWLTAKPNAALRFDKSTGNGFSQCLCAWANPCKFITKRWNNFMHVPQVQHFARFISKYFHGGGSVWWGRQEQRFEIPRVSSHHTQWGARLITASFIPCLQKMWPPPEYSGSTVSRGGRQVPSGLDF